MATPILATKLYIPSNRTTLVARPHLLERLNGGLHQPQGFSRKLTLVSAPAGFGKTTLVSTWVQQLASCHVAWLSLDETDNDGAQFLTYLVAALQTIYPNFGQKTAVLLQAPQLPALKALLPTLLDELLLITEHFLLVLDDYHLLNAKAIDDTLAFLLAHLPPQMHLVITTREDPPLPLARMRARAQLVEVRAADLRFTPTEAADFLNQVMGLALTADEVAALESRTEGWIAGLQLAAVSMQSHRAAGPNDVAAFIHSFTGSHRFIMDYLLEEVLEQQPAHVQEFLLYTSVLDRLCGGLCDALLHRDPHSEQHIDSSARSSQATLESIEQANLFLIPLDNERRWYRYHHLFAELLRQRLQERRSEADAHIPPLTDLHLRASYWYEAQGLELDAFHHAIAANDVGRAERLVEGNGMPLHFRGIIRPVLTWLDTLPDATLDDYPSLRIAHASTLLATGQVRRTEDALAAAEQLLQCKEAEHPFDAAERDLLGRVAAIRATVAAGFQKVDRMIAESERALDYLQPENLAFRTSTNWKLGYAYHLTGDLGAAKRSYLEAVAQSKATGNTIFAIMSHIGLGDVYLQEAALPLAAEQYHNALALSGEQPLPSAGEAFSGLARIAYEWNELEDAQRYATKGLQLGRQWEQSDSPIRNEWILGRIRFATGDLPGARAQLQQTIAFMQEHNFTRCLNDIVETLVITLLAQGDLEEAVAITTHHDFPLCQARVALVQSEHDRALSLVEALSGKLFAQGEVYNLLKAKTLQVVILAAMGRQTEALQLLAETLVIAQVGGCIRLFVDNFFVNKGDSLAQALTALLPTAAVHGIAPDYIQRILAAFVFSKGPEIINIPQVIPGTSPALPEPLSEREMEVLQLIAAGRKNQEIADDLFVSLNTVRYHTKNIYGKLGVNKRTQAVAKAQALQLL